MKKIILLCIFLSFILSACSQDDKKFEPETLYHYSGEMLSLVDQRENEYSKELGILYTLDENTRDFNRGMNRLCFDASHINEHMCYNSPISLWEGGCVHACV